MEKRPLKKRYFFRTRLQYKLIAAFLFIGVVPMVLSTFTAVKFISARLEKDIETRIEKAAQITMKEIENFKKKATLVSEIILKDPIFITAFERGDSRAIDSYRRRINIDVLMVADLKGRKLVEETGALHSRPMPPGETLILIQGKGIKQLIAGTIVPIKEGKEVIGTIYTGYMLDETFAKEMEKSTGTDTMIYAKSHPEIEDKEENIEIRGLNTTEEIIETVFKEGKPFYDPRTRFNDLPYHGFYQPLLSSQGAVLGMVFFGIPRQYSFQTAIYGHKFFPIITGMGVVLALIVGYTIASGITNPINSFVKAARAISSGDFDQRVNVRSGDEIGVLSAAFNLMTRRLRQFKQLEEGLRRKERLAALGELSAGVAHEIRNPLGVIKNSAEMIRKKKDGDTTISELSTFIIDETDRLNNVVDNLLEFARPRAPKLRWENIIEIMERALRIVEEKSKAKGIEIRKEFSPNLHEKILCDNGQMEQAFLNILINAIDGIKNPGGEVSVRIVPGREFEEEPSIIDYLYIQVKDNGSGIKEEDMGKIFNPFFTTKPDGTGLGLSIVHKIIENHDGEISAESSPGKGTTMTIKMPIKLKEQ